MLAPYELMQKEERCKCVMHALCHLRHMCLGHTGDDGNYLPIFVSREIPA